MDECEGMILAELLCARLCHDLAGAVGAVATGAELLAEEDAGENSEAVDLLATSAATAVARLRFLRLAFGLGGTTLPADQLQDLVSTFLASPLGCGEDLRLDWEDCGQIAWEPGPAKLLLNLVLLGRDCLPRGGALAVRARRADGPVISVIAEGPHAAPGEAAVVITAAGAEKLGPRGAQGFYAMCLAANLGLTVNYKTSHDCVEFTAVKH
jgi:histidine phosphotransferase ChpT